MIEQVNPEKVLFLDIETVPMSNNYESMPEVFRQLWEKKSAHFRKEQETASDVFDRAGIYAEFGKIICISVGIIFHKNERSHLRLKSFYGDNEKQILSDFAQFLYKNKQYMLCAHNGKEFDFPYIARRMIVNGIALPEVLEISGKKPWETPFIDTMELWKFGDYKNYTSLDLLAALFGIASSKDDIDGSMVAGVYYRENNLPRIVKYCEKDVIVIARLFQRYKLLEMISDECIESATMIHP